MLWTEAENLGDGPYIDKVKKVIGDVVAKYR